MRTVKERRKASPSAFFKSADTVQNQEALMHDVLAKLRNNIITIYAHNLSEGIGDAKHAIDMYDYMSKLYKGSDTKIKLVLLVDNNKLRILHHLIPKEWLNNLTVSKIGEKISDDESTRDIVILSGYERDSPLLSDLAKESILRTPHLAHHLQTSNCLINVSTPLSSDVASMINPHCLSYSILEYGPTNYGKMGLVNSFLVECSLGTRRNDAGIKFDQTVWDYSETAETNEGKVAILLNLKRSFLTSFLDFYDRAAGDDDEHSIASRYFDTHHMGVGYVQSSEAARQFIALNISTTDKPYIDLVIPAKFVDKEILELLAEKGFHKLTIMKPNGSMDKEYKMPEDAGATELKVMRIIDYQDIHENELRILASVAQMVAGSGDTSISVALSNPNALPFFIIPTWKTPFYNEFYNCLLELDASTSKFEHLKIYLGFMNYATKKHLPSLKQDLSTYAANHQSEILKEWQEFVSYLHTNKNLKDYLSELTLTAALHQAVVENREITSEFITSMIASNNQAALNSMLFTAILNDNKDLIKKICSEIRYLPHTQNPHSPTTFALSLGKIEIAELLVDKDYDLLMKTDVLWDLPEDKRLVAMKFFNDRRIDISYSVPPPEYTPSIWMDEFSDYFDDKGLSWLSDRYHSQNKASVNIGGSSSPAALIEYTPDVFILPIEDGNKKQFLCSFHGDYVLLKKEENSYQRNPLPPEQRKILDDVIEQHKTLTNRSKLR